MKSWGQRLKPKQAEQFHVKRVKMYLGHLPSLGGAGTGAVGSLRADRAAKLGADAASDCSAADGNNPC